LNLDIGAPKSTCARNGKESSMATKNNDNVDSELGSTPFQPQADETSKRQTPSHEEIRRRAYEIYLERDGRPGDGLDDWLRAERELEKVALFARDWNRLQQRVAQTPKAEIDIRPMETKGTGNQ
jgi:hypothetical protein